MAKRQLGGKTPGPQKPEKYPGGQVGPAYQQWGEQIGLLYYPATDTYYEDPKYKQQFYEQNGLGPDGGLMQPEPEKPGMLDTIAPFIATGGGLGLGQALMNPGTYSTLGGLFGGAAQGGAPAVSASPLGVSGIGPMSPEMMAGNGASIYGSEAGTGAAAPQLAPLATDAAAPQVAGGGMLDGLGSMGVAADGFGLGLGPISVPGVAAGAGVGYLQGKGLLDAFKGKDMGLSSELALALPTFGASMLWDPVSNALGFGDKDRWKTEGNRLRELEGDGVYLPDNLIESIPTGGRSFDSMNRGDYAADFIGRDSQGNWVNNKFNQSRDVADLRGEDIVNYSTWAEKDPEWFRKPLEERIALANQALQSGAVNEHHGTIDIDYDKFPAGAPAAPPGSAQTPASSTAPFTTNAQGQVNKPPTAAAYPPKGTRLSPGIYADGKGGSYRA